MVLSRLQREFDPETLKISIDLTLSCKVCKKTSDYGALVYKITKKCTLEQYLWKRARLHENLFNYK